MTVARWTALVLVPVIAASVVWKLVDSKAGPAKPNTAAGRVSPRPSLPSSTATVVAQDDSDVTGTVAGAAPSPSPAATKFGGKIQVLDGSSNHRLGKLAFDRLKSLGYHAVGPQNSIRTYPATTIFFQPGFDAAAREVATALGHGQVKPALSNLDKSIPLTVVAGNDFR